MTTDDDAELSLPDLITQVDALSREAGYPGIPEAFSALDRGELDGTFLEMQLRMLRYIDGGRWRATKSGTISVAAILRQEQIAARRELKSLVAAAVERLERANAELQASAPIDHDRLRDLVEETTECTLTLLLWLRAEVER